MQSSNFKRYFWGPLKVKHLQIRLEDEEHARLAQKAKELKFDSLQQAGHAAVLEFTTPKAHLDEHNLSNTQRAYMAKLATILVSRDKSVIDAVTQNIDVFFDRLRPEAAKKHGV